MRSPHPTPSALDGQEDLRCFLDEIGLEFGRQHQIAITFLHRGEGGEDAAADAKIDRAHVRAFGGAFERKGEAAEI